MYFLISDFKMTGWLFIKHESILQAVQNIEQRFKRSDSDCDGATTRVFFSAIKKKKDIFEIKDKLVKYQNTLLFSR